MAAGVTWHLLHVMDHSSYWTATRHDYIVIPAAARTSSTRLRWWQRLPDGQPRAMWSLDDVNVGGMDISPSGLYEKFDHGLNQDKWEFYPSGRVDDSVCGGPHSGKVMAWPEGWSRGVAKMITTCQLIVQEDFMIQFKVND